MVVAPHIFGHVERQPGWPNPSLRSQAVLQVAPEALQAVDAGAVSTPEFALVMLHQAVNVALGSDARVGGQGVGAHDGSSPDVASDKRVEGSSYEIRDDLGPDLPPRHRMLKTGVLLVPRPRLRSRARSVERRFRQNPPDRFHRFPPCPERPRAPRAAFRRAPRSEPATPAGDGRQFPRQWPQH